MFQTDVHLAKVHHHVTGVKCHGERMTQVYTWTDVFHPDSNVTMNCLVNVLDIVCKVNKIQFNFSLDKNSLKIITKFNHVYCIRFKKHTL